MFSPNQQILLTLFFSRPDMSYHLHEIGRLLGKKPGVFQKALNALEREGVLISERRGNQRLVSLNQTYPLRKELKTIIQKTVGVEAVLKTLVAQEPKIQAAFVFGSYALNRMRSHSDIDLVLVGAQDAEDGILGCIEKLEKRIQRDVNVKFYTVAEYRKKKKNGDPFLTEIFEKTIITLKGKP